MAQFATLFNAVFAGIQWTPHISGVLTVMVGVVVLGGSIYLILATNMGARLGLLVIFAGLFGWLVILTTFWWIQPPGNGPRGQNASWKPVEVFVQEDGNEPLTSQLESLPAADSLPTQEDLIAAHPELAEEFPNGFTLSDLKGAKPDLFAEAMAASGADLGDWRVVAASSAGEAQGVADTDLVVAGYFSATTDYKKLTVFEFGGKPTRRDECPDADRNDFLPDDVLCRIKYRVGKVVGFKHPTHYAVVQVQQVIPQEARAGEAPPLPVVDPEAPVISVLMVRNLGNVRAIPALYFVISFIGFAFFCTVLHQREKILNANIAAAEAAESAAGA